MQAFLCFCRKSGAKHVEFVANQGQKHLEFIVNQGQGNVGVACFLPKTVIGTTVLQ